VYDHGAVEYIDNFISVDIKENVNEDFEDESCEVSEEEYP